MIYVLEVVFYGLASAASALVLSATLLVIRSERPRINGIAYLSGFVFGTVIACGLGLALGQAAVDRLDSHDTLKESLGLVLGLVLIVVGVRAWRSPPRSVARGAGRRRSSRGSGTSAPPRPPPWPGSSASAGRSVSC